MKKDLPTTLETLDTGEGLYVAVGDALPSGGVKVKYFYSNEEPDLEIGAGITIRPIKISYSSTANDNKQLLHLLFGKTRTQ